MAEKLQKAPALYAIIAFKLLKGAFFLSIALGLYTLSDNDLPFELHRVLGWFHLDPERKFFTDMAANLEKVTPNSMLWAASGSLLYGLFAVVEGTGLAFRASWAGWLSIGQSAFFIPIEIYELTHKFRYGLLVVMLINIFIVEYLFRNRATLFHHHHDDKPAGKKKA
jgi:uncharacterized membrane protein (DUF2068 family)